MQNANFFRYENGRPVQELGLLLWMIGLYCRAGLAPTRAAKPVAAEVAVSGTPAVRLEPARILEGGRSKDR